MENIVLLKLPIDISTFRKMRKSGYLYVDKTKYAYDLITGGNRYFLSRPRRFGKSLFVSTLREILHGNKELFEGLWIHNSDYNWEKYGVIEFDLSSLGIDSTETFKTGLCHALGEVVQDYSLEVEISTTNPELALRDVVKELYNRFGRVAILVDEYDNPILQVLKDANQAEEIRNATRRFFAAIKGMDAFIDFVFITGVSAFARAGLFSGINNLLDITLDNAYSNICGYTNEEVDSYFSDYIKEWCNLENISYDDLRLQIKTWYNGYTFGSNLFSVYNPFSFMNALRARSFKNFWFQSGTPNFLVEELKKEYRKEEYRIIDPEKFETTEESLGIFEVRATPLPSLMFQTGYLTIKNFDKGKKLYRLGYPNYEVKTALQTHLLGIFTQLDFISAERISLQLRAALIAGNIDEVITLIKQLFTNVPYQLHMKEEKFYHALLQVTFGAAGIKSQSEYSMSHGRIDLLLELPNVLYVIEIKLNSSVDVALDQVDQRHYYESLLVYGKPITLLGLSFKREPKNFDLTYKVKYINNSQEK
ncbi:MAG: AAA-ATPase-like protein [candidate division TM6 bacterium GW2011_GWF2_37_49]|nr:MAG: AAA-ATPase-like protein [candidate division TM6 bacterium GW2011_GWF2_37_49]